MTSCDLKHPQAPSPRLETVTTTPSKTEAGKPSIVYLRATSTLLAYPIPAPSQYNYPYPPPETISTPLPTPSPLPVMGYDLIYISPTGINDYELLYWDHHRGVTEVLVTEDTTSSVNQDKFTLLGNVSAYSISHDGKHMIVLRVVHRPMKSSFYEFIFFDMQNRLINPLTRFDTQIYQSAISPDGLWVGYLLDRKLYSFSINDPSRIFEWGNCDNYCLNFIWSPDSEFIATSNEYGIWISDIYNNTTRLLASDRMLWAPNEKLAVFALPAWSPDSRFLLAWEPDTENGEWYAIDVKDNRSVRIPNSFQYPYPSARIFWLQDGRLCVVRGGDLDKGLAPSVEIWSVTPEKENLITLDQTIPIPVKPDLYPISPIQLDDGRIAFVLIDRNVSNLSNQSGLYVIGLDNIPIRISDSLPPGFDLNLANANWSPDGNGVIYYDLSSGTLMSIYVNGRLGPEIPPASCCFTWLK